MNRPRWKNALDADILMEQLQLGKRTGEAMLKPNIVNKPVIATVNGYCLTGGFEMIMGADLRIASDDAVFQMREAKLGIMPTSGSNFYLPRLLTPCRAMEILLTTNNFNARTLWNWEFLNKVVDRSELIRKTENKTLPDTTKRVGSLCHHAFKHPYEKRTVPFLKRPGA